MCETAPTRKIKALNSAVCAPQAELPTPRPTNVPVAAQYPRTKCGRGAMIFVDPTLPSPKEDTREAQLHYLYREDAEFDHIPPNNSDAIELRPPYFFSTGAVYHGEWKGRWRHGFGAQRWPDGATFEGEWVLNRVEGLGRFTHIDGDSYTGEWKNNEANGYGIYCHNAHTFYHGEWKGDKQNGFGRETWADGSKFAGHFTDGVKDGHGLYAWGDGSHYAGQWVANKSEGYGRFTSQPLDDEEDREGKQYRGGWKNGMMCGVGEYLWDTGQSYSGHYIEDQKHGFGVFQWNEKTKYEGTWKIGKQDGYGVYTSAGGQRVGVWSNGSNKLWFGSSS